MDEQTPVLSEEEVAAQIKALEEANKLEKESNPIPEGSVVTEDMVQSFIAHDAEHAQDSGKLTYGGSLGNLLTLEKGGGEFPSFLEDKEAFLPLKQKWEENRPKV